MLYLAFGACLLWLFWMFGLFRRTQPPICVRFQYGGRAIRLALGG